MRSVLVRPFVIGFGAAVLGVGVMLLAIHLWSDHVALHVVVDFLNRNADKINKLP